MTRGKAPLEREHASRDPWRFRNPVYHDRDFLVDDNSEVDDGDDGFDEVYGYYDGGGGVAGGGACGGNSDREDRFERGCKREERGGVHPKRQ